eukprot:3369270-Rhodomonas_salina.1
MPPLAGGTPDLRRRARDSDRKRILAGISSSLNILLPNNWRSLTFSWSREPLTSSGVPLRSHACPFKTCDFVMLRRRGRGQALASRVVAAGEVDVLACRPEDLRQRMGDHFIQVLFTPPHADARRQKRMQAAREKQF